MSFTENVFFMALYIFSHKLLTAHSVHKFPDSILKPGEFTRCLFVAYVMTIHDIYMTV